MATFTQLPSGNWRVQIRRKQSYASESFRRYADAKRWALATERGIDLGEVPTKRARVDATKFEHLIDLHVARDARTRAEEARMVAIRGV